MLEELQALDEGQLETAQIETRPVHFAEGDVVALKHNWKRYLESFFLAIHQEDLHCNNFGIFERTMRINWLEPSQEDPLVYTVGNEDNNNPPQCILDVATVVQDGEKFILSRNEEQRLPKTWLPRMIMRAVIRRKVMVTMELLKKFEANTGYQRQFQAFFFRQADRIERFQIFTEYLFPCVSLITSLGIV